MVATNILPQNAADTAIAALPPALREPTRELAWAIFQDSDNLTLAEATRLACDEIHGVIAFEVCWDFEAEEARQLVEAEGLPTEPEPPHPAAPALRPAIAPEPIQLDAQQRKAAWYAGQGVMAQPFGAGHLVPSGSRAGVVHFVSAEGVCSCEAGQHGRRCWHVALVAMPSGELVAA